MTTWSFETPYLVPARPLRKVLAFPVMVIGLLLCAGFYVSIAVMFVLLIR